ncbi:formyltransferase family protein [Crateriforma conspicua]|uniref:Formyltetrahydrofolate deformylase n=1 Tax=Crateriforma conspicua TaxID=2527996 RepID=A0A5C5YA76_9PLAN|nr:formyltransferase family protein [Crateriforma conspicua]QDV61716.1 Formyltetrahydrofolate deformylase [Crateriforma conspicua]TWT72034.1 Formyltetrahydrofolate deformylase [Crateriforma conspicua]
MEVVITALGPDSTGLADPIIHHVTGRGARINEIQMYDHDEEQLFAMLCRIDLESAEYEPMIDAMRQIGDHTKLSIRVWSPDRNIAKPRIALCGTFVEHTPRAVLEAARSGEINADVTVLISNRKKLAPLADQFGIPFEMIGDKAGSADDREMVHVMDRYDVDYVVLARYMRILPAATCWQFAGGRILNLHHGLLPGFPGFRPYHDAYNARMLTFGATCHFIIPELDAGNQTVNQRTFSVAPGTPLDSVISRGERENEPACLVEGVRRVVDREVQLRFHRVVARRGSHR